jgi:putative acetyltransferase
MTYTIRAMTEADLPATIVLRNLPLARWGTLSTPYESTQRWREIRATPQPLQTHLVACDEDRMVGQAGLFRNENPRRAHAAGIGICVHDDWQGKGVGSALFAALMDLADNWLGLRRLELGVFADNARAVALYRKFGFEVEATERADTFREGSYIDAYRMARLRGDLPVSVAPPPPRPDAAKPGPFSLRATEPEDGEAVAELMRQPLVRHFTLRLPFCTPEDVRFLTHPTDRTTKTLVAVADGKPVGAALMTIAKGRRGHAAELAVLAVHDAYQGRGIGTALVAALLDIADNWLNLKRIQLGVAAENAAAIALYRAHGFETEGRLRADSFRAGGFADSLAMARVR